MEGGSYNNRKFKFQMAPWTKETIPVGEKELLSLVSLKADTIESSF